jgi:2-amino-4-hydroxy-6-hydroxymethyldihydropteridine diphosphokinase
MPAWIGLGGNLEGSQESMVAALAEITKIGVWQTSSLYRSAPRERTDQPDYLNAALALETELTPRPLLAELKAIERRLGRDPFGERYGPRLIDLDLLAIDDLCIEDVPDLVVPHPRLAERRFALQPLAELDPDLRPWAACPGERRDLTVAQALAAVMDQDVEVLEGPGWARDIGPSGIRRTVEP